MRSQSKFLDLAISEPNANITLTSRIISGASLTSQFGMTYLNKGQAINPFYHQPTITIEKETVTSSTRFGALNPIQINLQNDAVTLTISIGLLEDKPLTGIKMSLVNNCENPIILEKFTLLHVEPGELQLGSDPIAKPVFFSNGWQSWSHSGVYQLGDKQRTSILGPFQNPMIINPGTPELKQKNRFSGDMFGVVGDSQQRTGLVTGFASQKNHFGSLSTTFHPQPSLSVWANGDGMAIPGGMRVVTDWLLLGFIDLDALEPLRDYFACVSLENEIVHHPQVPTGWCSWYHYYEDISEESLTANLEAMVEQKPALPLTLFQIDDGFESRPGDWFRFDPAFPDGVEPLAQRAKAEGLIPGLWLAPFIVHPKADLVKDHPDWLLRDDRGRRVNAGFVWNSFTYALDLTVRDALDYACSVIRTAVEEWGFSYLKLDFLYAAALDGVHQDRTLSRAQILRKGLEALRQAAGSEATLLACGCPLGSALGLFEAMRISADVSGYWYPHYPPISPLLKKEPHMPAARNALQNIISRAPLHRHWWINDPDCLLIRADTELSLAEVQTLATAISLTGGSLLLSDDLTNLTPERMQLAQTLLPVIDGRPRLMDWFDSPTPTKLRLDLGGAIGKWYVLALFNWNDRPADLILNLADFDLAENTLWWLREFWTGELGKVGPESPFRFYDVPAHGVRVAAIRKFVSDQPAYIGSDLHISQGNEISRWQVDNREIKTGISLGRSADGKAFMYLPERPAGAWLNGVSHPLQPMAPGVYALDLKDVNDQEVIIKR